MSTGQPALPTLQPGVGRSWCQLQSAMPWWLRSPSRPFPWMGTSLYCWCSQTLCPRSSSCAHPSPGPRSPQARLCGTGTLSCTGARQRYRAVRHSEAAYLPRTLAKHCPCMHHASPRQSMLAPSCKQVGRLWREPASHLGASSAGLALQPCLDRCPGMQEGISMAQGSRMGATPDSISAAASAAGSVFGSMKRRHASRT